MMIEPRIVNTIYEMKTEQTHGTYTSLRAAIEAVSEAIKTFEEDPMKCEIWEVRHDNYGNEISRTCAF